MGDGKIRIVAGVCNGVFGTVRIGCMKQIQIQCPTKGPWEHFFYCEQCGHLIRSKVDEAGEVDIRAVKDRT